MRDVPWSFLKRRSDRIQRLEFLFPFSLFLIIACTAPLAWGIAEKNLLFILVFAGVEIISGIILNYMVQEACRLTDQLLEDANRFFQRSEARTACPNKDPPWKVVEKFLEHYKL